MFLFSADGSGFVSIGTIRYTLIGDLIEHPAVNCRRRHERRRRHRRGENDHRSQGMDEAQTQRIDVVRHGGLQQDHPHDIHGDEPCGEFSGNALGGSAAKHIR